MTQTVAKPKPAPKAADREVLSLMETIRPSDVAGVVNVIRSASANRQAVYPLGGRTSLDYGLTPTQPGIGLELAELNRVVDYTPRDMTVVVEAGTTVGQLAATLAEENQWLPIDVPRANEATLGGAVATNWNGSRRYGHGTWRDYVIGISAVDGRGTLFKAGGRVVKNVAGYDFCKLLTGSLGTLGVITQLVFKVKPRPTETALLVAPCDDLQQADRALDALNRQAAGASVLDLLVGTSWSAVDELPPCATNIWLVIGVEGSVAEVNWMTDEVSSGLRAVGVKNCHRIDEQKSAVLRGAIAEFSACGVGARAGASPLVIKAVVPSSKSVDMIRMLLACDPQCAVQCHAGSGVVLARFAEFSANDLTRQLVGKLRPAAIERGGSLIVASTTLEGLTAPIVWGSRTAAHRLLENVKRAFDPHHILNPGRLF